MFLYIFIFYNWRIILPITSLDAQIMVEIEFKASFLTHNLHISANLHSSLKSSANWPKTIWAKHFVENGKDKLIQKVPQLLS